MKRPRPPRSARLFNLMASLVYLAAIATVLADVFVWRP